MGKYDHIDFRPPEGARNQAKKALEWKDEHGDAVKGGTAVGWTRARQLADGGEMSVETVKRMYKFFQRHEKNKAINPEYKDEPWRDNGYVAWLIWGADEGKRWAEKLWSQMEEADKKTAKDGLWDNIRQKRERGEEPANPGDEDYPEDDTWEKLTASELFASEARKKFNLKKEYQKWNTKLFGGELPMIPFKWVRSKRVGGYVKVRMNRMTGEHTATVLAISDYLTLDENRFNQIMIHEMIHVWQAVHNIDEPKGGHGRTFVQKAREIGSKVGLKIPLTEDITNLEVSDAVATKDFMVVLIDNKGSKGHMVFTMSNWNSNNAKFEADLERASKMYRMEFTIVKSNDRGLLKARHKKHVLGKRGRISWNRSSPGFHEKIMGEGKTEEVVKEKETDYSKHRSLMLGIGNFLEKALEKKYGTDFKTSVNTRSDSATGRDFITVVCDALAGNGSIVIKGMFLVGELEGITVFWVSASRQEAIIRGRKYPTPRKIMDAIERQLNSKIVGLSFGVKKTAS